MANLQKCLGSSEPGHNYTVQVHAFVTWVNAGQCEFIHSSPSLIQVQGSATILKKQYNFDIIITDGSGGQPVLTVNGTPDPGATLNGCTIQADVTLDGLKFSVSPDGKNSEIHTPGALPNLKIAY